MYRVNISSPSNILGDPDFFIGTGFLGEEFTTYDELKELIKKYATFNKDGKSYWRKQIKLTFSLNSTISKFKAEGDRQCKEQGFVNLFAAAAVAKNDPFHNIEIHFRPGKWEKDGIVFSFVLVKGDEITPKPGKLQPILEELGMKF